MQFKTYSGNSDNSKNQKVAQMSKQHLQYKRFTMLPFMRTQSLVHQGDIG